ncbi:hypothetical protein J7937_21610 [Vibrio parahaemolyticus]|nr:hypothetical protein [Vibrio parahaemolyticus]MCF9079941.1 hypothetical protein [Vibrio parahaemolyticus]
MSYINNLGDYIELLHSLLTKAVGDKATVQYDDEPEEQDKPKPFIKLPLPEIDEFSYSDDGRHQNMLNVTVLVKVPKNVSNPSVQAANIGGFVSAQMKGQYFVDPEKIGVDENGVSRALNPDFDCVDEPEEIQGYPLKWHTNDQGYAITFMQTIRYGKLEDETFLLKSITTQEGDSEVNTVYESDESGA